ncbi:MAG: hypothetical protein JO110_05820 [Acetobacteraceae bacterium]|nr:hypothetical protein [Acetobacteraceae bacterium]
MLNQTTLLADELGKQLSRTFLRSFGSGDQRIAALSTRRHGSSLNALPPAMRYTMTPNIRH